MRLFDGMMMKNDDIDNEKSDTPSCGISIRTDIPIIVELAGTLR